MSIRRMYLFIACLLFALCHRRYIVLLYYHLFTILCPDFIIIIWSLVLGDFPLPTSVVVTTPLIGWSWYLLMSTLIVDNLSASIRALYSLVSIRSSGWVDVRCLVYLIAGHSVSAIGYQTLAGGYPRRRALIPIREYAALGRARARWHPRQVTAEYAWGPCGSAV